MEKIHTQAELNNMTGAALVALYNKFSNKPVNKFADKATAVKRVYAVLPEAKSKSAPAKSKGPKSKVAGAAQGVRWSTFRNQTEAEEFAREWSARTFNRKAVCRAPSGEIVVVSQMTQRAHQLEVLVRC